jgi:hypothetical protein
VDWAAFVDWPHEISVSPLVAILSVALAKSASDDRQRGRGERPIDASHGQHDSEESGDVNGVFGNSRGSRRKSLKTRRLAEEKNWPLGSSTLPSATSRPCG